jgi:hypothetical protein
VRDTRLEDKAVAFLEHVVLIADAELERSAENDDAFLIGFVSVSLVPRPSQRLDHRHDHLQALRIARRNEEVLPPTSRMDETSPLLATHQSPDGRGTFEQGTDGCVESFGQPAQRCHGWVRHAALDLRDETLGDTGFVGQLPQGEAARLSKRAHLVSESHLLTHGGSP